MGPVVLYALFLVQLRISLTQDAFLPNPLQMLVSGPRLHRVVAHLRFTAIVVLVKVWFLGKMMAKNRSFEYIHLF